MEETKKKENELSFLTVYAHVQLSRKGKNKKNGLRFSKTVAWRDNKKKQLCLSLSRLHGYQALFWFVLFTALKSKINFLSLLLSNSTFSPFFLTCLIKRGVCCDAEKWKKKKRVGRPKEEKQDRKKNWYGIRPFKAQRKGVQLRNSKKHESKREKQKKNSWILDKKRYTLRETTVRNCSRFI